jgi:hypothetical protein
MGATTEFACCFADRRYVESLARRAEGECMACLVVAAWTWVIAWVSLGQCPGWALISSAIGGFAVGLRLMIAVYEDQTKRIQRHTQVRHPARLRVVRAASGA